MFTVGIFTTHIPYVAFVVFYAYFVIFGVEKASEGEIQSSEKNFLTEYQVSTHLNSDDQSNFNYHSYFDGATDFVSCFYKPKIRYGERAFALFHYVEILTSFSNRPPPSLN